MGDGIWPPTQPRVTVRSIFLRNITTNDAILPSAGVLRCNASNPCTDFHLEDVLVTSRLLGNNASILTYDCASTEGTATASSSPQPTSGRDGSCVWASTA